MTLTLTELSHAGIAMAADSAISEFVNGKLITKDQKQWRKVLRVPRIKGGLSYWGSIGLITKQRFDEWLEWRIQTGSYTDLRSFADYIAGEMNRAVGNKPLSDGHQVGIHVAGFQPWPDGISRGTLYHVHNGHSHVEFQRKTMVQNGKQVLLEIIPSFKLAPRELFSRHEDFSPETQKPDTLTGDTAYLTRNGDYAAFSIIFDHYLMPLLNTLNVMPDFSIPDTTALGPRIGFLKSLIEITINVYQCSSVSRHIGGKVLTLGIRPDGTYLG